MAAIDGNFLTSSVPLRAGSAVAAIIVVDRERYLMQLRDDAPHIWYPGHWGLFGGAIDAGEDEIAALPASFARSSSWRWRPPSFSCASTST